ncbi:hypothetical protein [Desulfoscipio geothermicus]|uniref:Uncharacterized protein n=1 Tax=Desulfoscipio geothermicus DSM 3669 TaxID=1121426 RepID=A0A1I6E8T0_9FIRM|nr:hypothetical protein [Desulfoscipio geothermicus]SFR14134.1 hypothetical protein SAMN05660706_13013 [Desulfoscipio geothermicus DSM 3669]
MGITLGLDILPHLIEAEEWHQFYDKVFNLIKEFPLPVLRFGVEKKFTYDRLYLSRNPESHDQKGKFLAIVGDAQSGTRAEQFIIYRDISVYRKNNLMNNTNLHILLQKENKVRVFYEKTQSYPYHDLVLAIIILAENIFPGRAYAFGDLTARKLEPIMTWLEHYRGKPLKKPVLLRTEKLWQILEQKYSGLKLAENVADKLVEGPAPLYRFLKKTNLPLLRKFLKKVLKEYKPGTIGAMAECLHILDGTHDFELLVELACADPEGPRWQPEKILHIAHWLGAFSPRGKDPCATMSIGFMPPEYFNVYYLTDFYIEKEKACQKIAGITGTRVESLLSILSKYEKEKEAICSMKRENYLLVSNESNKAEQEQESNNENENKVSPIKIVFRKEDIRSLHEQLKQSGISYDAYNLKHLLNFRASQNHIILTEEAWNILDQEDNPDLLALVFQLFSVDNHAPRIMNLIDFIVKNLHDIEQSWQKGAAWDCPSYFLESLA